MSYLLERVSMRVDSSPESMARIGEVWADIVSGRLPLMFDSDHVFQKGLSPITEYSEYSDGWNGPYTMTILTVRPDFFEKMDAAAARGEYLKYEGVSETDDISEAATDAWFQVQTDEAKGLFRMAFQKDYESTVPAQYSHDGKAHCYLYIGVQSTGHDSVSK